MRKAFSLIELLIVVFIIGVVYTLVITNFHKKKSDEKSLNLSNLQEQMRSLKYEKSARFLCLDDCSECEMIADGKKVATYENFLDKSVKIYRFDEARGMQEIENDVFFNENGIQERVCFSYTMDKSGVGDQVLVAFRNRVYDFSDYLNGTKTYISLEDAAYVKNNLIQEVKR
ncbi:type II secretion system GspH family protein [bacterium]|nr:type II secretion system GspH family protein [bacterium]MBU1884857.1 type II secretion system GspH family protein [bacterium]